MLQRSLAAPYPPMSTIIEQARRDLQIARSDAARAKQTYKATVEKLRAAELRVQKLEITELELAIEHDALRKRAAPGRR
jgi:hypothetical protein